MGEFSREKIMSDQLINETMIETSVTYTAEVDGRLVVIEHVPARVCKETGEQFFSPDTVERIQAIIAGGQKTGANHANSSLRVRSVISLFTTSWDTRACSCFPSAS